MTYPLLNYFQKISPVKDSILLFEKILYRLNMYGIKSEYIVLNFAFGDFFSGIFWFYCQNTGDKF